MAKIILCRGIQGSGKTTWAKNYCNEHPNSTRVNRDDLRAMMGCKLQLLTRMGTMCVRSVIVYIQVMWSR